MRYQFTAVSTSQSGEIPVYNPQQIWRWWFKSISFWTRKFKNIS